MAATEIFQLLGKIGLDGVEEAKKGIDGVNDKAGTLGTVFNKAGKVAAGIGKAVAVGVGAAATAVGAITKASVDGYAEYEQLVGGVKTLFNETELSLEDYAISVGKTTQEVFAEWSTLTAGARWVTNNAQQAYITAGLSANEYMETVTSFSASLIQGLGGDTVEAAQIADMAITDMADNANKMGTDIASIQNAYQGFAKQNFTMLDNLKLGYGGTKTEMERLLRDAEKYAGLVEGSFSIDNFADISKAINIVQTEMGIYGATAAEAMTTIQGSANATKAAWKNLVVAFATDEYELEETVGNFVDSAVVMIGNIAERVQEILPRLVEGLNLLITELTPFLTEFIGTMLPGLIEGATTLFVGLVEALPTILQILIEQLPFILTSIGTALIEAFPVLLETVKMLFGQIWDYIAENLFGVEGNFDETFAKVEEIFNNVWSALQETWDLIGQPIWDLIQSCIDTVRGVFEEKMPQIQKFVSSCFEDISYFWENNLKPCFDAIGNFIENTLAPVFESVFNGFIGPAVDTAFAFIADLWNNTLKPVFTGITDFLTGVFTGDMDQAFGGIVSVVEGIWNGLVSVIKTPINQVINLINSFIGGLNQLTIPDWVPLVGGKGINIPLIPLLEKGGILEKGQVGFLEGNGAEAVVPLDQNEKWINKVAMDMNAAIGGGGAADKLQELIDAFTSFGEDLFEMLADYFVDALEARDVVLDSGELVGALAVPMNERLGRIMLRKDRGR